jgi:LuxR family transcriptional regulator, maltose regulon positive regulatory protein
MGASSSRMTAQAIPLKRAAQPVRLAKLMPPQTDLLLARQRLFDRLDALMHTPMVWIAAPPGAGKTSLAAIWLQASSRPTLWVQLDAADADPASFFHYLALAAMALAHDSSPLPLFTADHSQQSLRFARRLYRELFVRLPPGTALVFDNVQDAAEASELPALLACLVEEQPPGFQVLALSREAPPPALARARAARKLRVLDAGDLLFQRDETLALALRSGFAASAQVEQVAAQSQGWAAGIMLLLERLRQQGVLAPVAPLGGRELVFDYFATEVFDATTPPVRERLLELSFLPRMSVAMATQLCGDADVGALLDALARRHLFTDLRLEPTSTY